MEGMTDSGSFTPPAGVRAEAKRALKWIAEGHAGDGFTDTGRKRASDLAAGRAVGLDTIKRMSSFLARHEVDKHAPGWSPGHPEFPSPGRVAWAAWGGDPAISWVKGILDRQDAEKVHKYNPVQPRDERGRWTDGSTGPSAPEPSNESKIRFAAMHREAASHAGMGQWGVWPNFVGTGSPEYRRGQREVRRGMDLLSLGERHAKAGRYMEAGLAYREASDAFRHGAEVSGNRDLAHAGNIANDLGTQYYGFVVSTREAQTAYLRATGVTKYSENQPRDYHGRFASASGRDGGADVHTSHAAEISNLANSARRHADAGRWAAAAKDLSWMNKHIDALVIDHEARDKPELSTRASETAYRKFSDRAGLASREVERALDTVRDHALRSLREPDSIKPADDYRARDAVYHATGAVKTDVVDPFVRSVGSIPVPPPSDPSDPSVAGSEGRHYPDVEVNLEEHRSDFGPHMEDKVAEAMAHAGVSDDHIEQFRSEFNASDYWMDRLRTVTNWVTVKTMSQENARMDFIMGGLTEDGFNVLKGLLDAGHLDPDVLIETMVTAEASKFSADQARDAHGRWVASGGDAEDMDRAMFEERRQGGGASGAQHLALDLSTYEHGSESYSTKDHAAMFDALMEHNDPKEGPFKGHSFSDQTDLYVGDDGKVHAEQARFTSSRKYLSPEGAEVIKRLTERGALDPTMVRAVETTGANVESYDATPQVHTAPLTPEGAEVINNLIDRGIIAPGSVSLT